MFMYVYMCMSMHMRMHTDVCISEFLLAVGFSEANHAK